MEPIDCNGLDQFETQQAITRGSWHMLNEEKKREHVRILIREAHKTKYEPEPSIQYIE